MKERRAFSTAAPASHGLVGRADLLRVLAVSNRELLTLDADSLTWFGYVRQVEAPRQELQPIGPVPGDVRADLRSPVRRLPLRMPHAPAIVRRVPRTAASPSTDAQRALGRAAPLTTEATAAPSSTQLVHYEDLVPSARLMPALRRLLGSTRLGHVDLGRLTERLANYDLPRYLPRTRSLRWHPDLVVVLDFSARLWPYRWDMHRVAKQLVRFCGRGAVSIRIVDGDPSTTWVDWQDSQRVGGRLERRCAWTMPPAGTPVLLVSDLGLFLGPESPAAGRWRRFVAALDRVGARPLFLAPLGASQLAASVVGTLRVLRWSPDARMRVERARGAGHASPEGLDQLLALMSGVRRVDPPLLRAMRRLTSGSGDSGLEGAAWSHADVEAGFTAHVKPEASARHLQRLRADLRVVHRALDRLRRRHHAHLRAVVTHEETWLLAENVPGAVSPEDIKGTREFFASLLRSLREGTRPDDATWRWVVRDIAARATDAMVEHNRELFDALVSVAYGPDQQTAMPAWADPARVDGGGAIDAWVVFDVAQGAVVLQAQAPRAGQMALGPPARVDTGLVKLRTTHEGRDVTRWLRPGPRSEVITALVPSQPVELETASESLTVARVERPRGAQAWGIDAQGLFVESPRVAGVGAIWREQLTFAPGVDGAWTARAPAAGPATQFGIDEFGVYADVSVLMPPAAVVQRFRWMEPGTFLMGSPESELERSDDEGPQHEVTITRGFWLADTACTQGLWQAVLGENPSRFTGDANLPVEQVSWERVQEFLRAFEALVPGSVADLPTEAEWEYACRAGTETPFSFGKQITPDLVNYDGNHPYASGPKGIYRETTVSVKSLPPNGWGLYEMHGNVWEWCADGMRDYSDGAEADPVGPVAGEDGARALRAFRGGSWLSDAGRARSAIRNAILPGVAFDGLGFRVCLRSIEPGQARPGGTRTSTRPPRDEAGEPRKKGSLLERAREALFSRGTKKR